MKRAEARLIAEAWIDEVGRWRSGPGLDPEKLVQGQIDFIEKAVGGFDDDKPPEAAPR